MARAVTHHRLEPVSIRNDMAFLLPQVPKMQAHCHLQESQLLYNPLEFTGIATGALLRPRQVDPIILLSAIGCSRLTCGLCPAKTGGYELRSGHSESNELLPHKLGTVDGDQIVCALGRLTQKFGAGGMRLHCHGQSRLFLKHTPQDLGVGAEGGELAVIEYIPSPWLKV